MEGQALVADNEIGGWMLSSQLAWLAGHAARRFNILEVGAWRGRTTEVLSRFSPGKVTVVDSWQRSDDPDEAEAAQESPAEVFADYLRNVGNRQNVHTYAMASRDAYRRLGHETFDMVFIDGDHRYEAVVDDIRMWGSLLRKGGLLCGHDGEYPDVSRALSDTLSNFTTTPFIQPPPFEHTPSLIWWTVR